MRVSLAGSSADRDEIGQLIESLPSYECDGYNWTTHPGYADRSLINPVLIAGTSYAQIALADGFILHVSENISAGAVGEAFLAQQRELPMVVLVPDLDAPGYGVPVENIWAHWFINQPEASLAGTLEEAIYLLKEAVAP